jgi:predicted RNase H-like nuclease
MSDPPPPFTAALGIDGARGGWVVARTGDPTPGFRLLAGLADLADEIALRGALVDIPIGLPDGVHATRACDARARRLLGPRRSSVFPAPARVTLTSPDWDSANAASRLAIGRGLPRQSWGLVPKIREVDALLHDRRGLRGRLRESHPELAFAWLGGGAPMDSPKSRPEGAAERWVRLDAVWPGVSEVAAAWSAARRGVALDDVADALALLALGEAGAVPLPAEPPTDQDGRPMEILVHPSLTNGAPP